MWSYLWVRVGIVMGLGMAVMHWYSPYRAIDDATSLHLPLWVQKWQERWSSDKRSLEQDFQDFNQRGLCLIVATSLRWTPLLGRTWWISSGHIAGIREGLLVVNHTGLVGRIGRVFPYTSEIIPLSHRNFRLSVTIAPENLEAIVAGQGTDQGKLLHFQDIPSDVHTGNTVQTSIHGPQAIPHIPVGTIVHKGNEKYVQYFVNTHNIGRVYVLCPCNHRPLAPACMRPASAEKHANKPSESPA